MRGGFGGMLDGVLSHDVARKKMPRSPWAFFALALGMIGLFLAATAVLLWLGGTGGPR